MSENEKVEWLNNIKKQAWTDMQKRMQGIYSGREEDLVAASDSMLLDSMQVDSLMADSLLADSLKTDSTFTAVMLSDSLSTDSLVTDTLLHKVDPDRIEEKEKKETPAKSKSRSKSESKKAKAKKEDEEPQKEETLSSEHADTAQHALLSREYLMKEDDEN
jgi:hypothetical protein